MEESNLKMQITQRSQWVFGKKNYLKEFIVLKHLSCLMSCSRLTQSLFRRQSHGNQSRDGREWNDSKIGKV